MGALILEMLENNQFIRQIELDRKRVESFEKYPFCLPVIRGLSILDLHPKVTFIVGENGTGKSTILEAVAAACGFYPEGGTRNFHFSSRASHSELYNYIRIIKGIRRPKDGFFLRAESFYNLATAIEELDKSGGGARIIDSYGGHSLHEQSHGESFFAVFMNRFRGNGLYILDEPEAALSPTRQMSMISRIHQLVGKNSQFIIATHSPILMAYPDAIIYEIKEGIKVVKYEETEHYQIMRSFLNNTQKMLNILMK